MTNVTVYQIMLYIYLVTLPNGSRACSSSRSSTPYDLRVAPQIRAFCTTMLQRHCWPISGERFRKRLKKIIQAISPRGSLNKTTYAMVWMARPHQREKSASISGQAPKSQHRWLPNFSITGIDALHSIHCTLHDTRYTPCKRA